MIFTYDLCVNPALLKDSATAVLSAILFHRLLGTINPHTREIFTNINTNLGNQEDDKDSTSRNGDSFTQKSYSLAYPCVAEPSIDALIDNRVRELVRRFVSSSRTPYNNIESSQVQGEKRQSSNLLYTLTVLFTSANEADAINLGGEWVKNEQGEEVWCWERWNIQCFEYISSRPQTDPIHVCRARSQVRSIIIDIISQATAHQDHLPPIRSTATSPFVYEIVILKGNSFPPSDDVDDIGKPKIGSTLTGGPKRSALTGALSATRGAAGAASAGTARGCNDNQVNTNDLEIHDYSDPDSRGDSQYENISHSGLQNQVEEEEQQHQSGITIDQGKNNNNKSNMPGESWTDRFKRIVMEAG